MHHTRAQFRVIRDFLNLTREDLATLLHVEPRAVRRWEMQPEDSELYKIPEGVWERVEAIRAAIIDEAQKRAYSEYDRLRESGEDESTLFIYASQAAYDHTDGHPKGLYRVENTVTRFTGEFIAGMRFKVKYLSVF